MKILATIARRLAATLLAATVGLFAVPSQGADTDLFFTGASGVSARPNVLIVLDNTANWGPMFAAEKAALRSVLASLPSGVFNIGLMMFVETGGGNDSNDGSYVRFAVRPFDQLDVDHIAGTLQNAADTIDQLFADLAELGDRSNNAVYGLAMNEAYKYFHGGASYSRVQLKRDYYGNPVGRPAGIPTTVLEGSGVNKNAFSAIDSFDYQKPVADACQQNHIIIISNGKANDNASATRLATDLLIAAGSAEDAVTLPVTPNDFQSNVADEWALFMSRAKKESEASKTVVTTHAILVEAAGAPPGQYPSGWEPYLRTLASVYGKGIFQKTDGNATNIANALARTFKEIQDTSSVFASSTLPINVNVRGTFLNQVYMGVFRPEAQGTPRWTGNLKLYKLAYDSGSGTVFLADSGGARAEDPRSGFIRASATSFWTTTSNFWTQNFESGFYFYSTLQTASDVPDGEFVEKGGSAQRARSPSAYATDLSSRPVYTDAGLSGTTLASFATTNGAITATSLDLSNVASVSSPLTRVGSVVTVTTSASHGFANGNSITIAGATPTEYNGSFVIGGVTTNTFTYLVTETPPTPATGTLLGRQATAGTVNVNTITRGVTPATATTATVTTAAPHPFVTGQTVTIGGNTQPEYNLSAVIVRTGASSFTYQVAESPSTTITTTGARACPAPTPAVTTCSSGIQVVDSASRTAGSVLTTIRTNGNHGWTAGAWILIEGLSPTDYNGRYQITPLTNKKEFTYSPAITLGPPDGTGGTAAVSNPAFTISPLARSGGTVTGTTNPAHGLVTGDSIVISGANEAAYNGTFGPVTVLNTTTFTFAIATGPATPITGSITAARSGGVNKDELINWVRGENRLLEDNPSGNAADIRGYHHGDVLHSRPAVVNYGRTNDNRDILVFYGANDGMLHAVKGGRDTADGLEKWAYIAEDHFPALKDLYTASPSILTTPRRYFFDGPITVYQNDADGDGALEGGGTEQVWLYAAMRRGGRGIHALDVSSPGTNLDAAPTLLWRKSSANVAGGYAELGQSWSEVQPVKVAAQSNPAVVFALGYDDAANDPTAPGTASSRQSAATMGRGVMVADAATGRPIWVVTPNASYTVPPAESGLSAAVHLQVDTMTCAIASDVAAVDIDLNGLVDRLYVADTCANIWRIDVASADVTQWTVRKLAYLGGSGTALRKFLFRPDVVRLPNEPAQLAILVGSGDREAPFDTTVQNAFYMVKDNADSNCPNCGVTDAGLCERNTLTNTDAVTACTTSCSGQTAIDPVTGLTCFQACLTARTACAIDHDNNPLTAPVVVADRGWKYTYPTTGEKTVNAPLTVGGTAFFGTNIPQSLVNANVCGGLGQANLYQVEYTTGAPAYDPTGTGVSTYYVEKQGGGFPPSPVGTVVTTDDGRQVEVVLSGPQVQQPPTVPLEKRYRIYWYKRLDRVP